jgi:hypothetical protein
LTDSSAIGEADEEEEEEEELVSISEIIMENKGDGRESTITTAMAHTAQNRVESFTNWGAMLQLLVIR